MEVSVGSSRTILPLLDSGVTGMIKARSLPVRAAGEQEPSQKLVLSEEGDGKS